MADPQLHDHFISLLESNLGIILKISKAYTSTKQDREDLVNDIAYEMWKALPNFKGNSKASTWIYRIALNTAMNYNRNTRKKREFIKSAIELKDIEPASVLESNPQIELLNYAISELDEFNKAIILLFLDGYKHEEIAEITGISTSNVGTRIQRIKEQLRHTVAAKQASYGN